MVSYIALSILITSSCLVNAVPTNKFYPFGLDSGDKTLPKNARESISPEISLNVPVKFYGDSYNSLYVSGNGLISFLIALQEFINMQFPLNYPVIAAFYANVDNRAGGEVFYRETSDPKLLSRMSNDLFQAFPNSVSVFRPTSLFVATWYQVTPSNRSTDKNTFQIVIASNGSESFVEFLYADDGIQWIQGEGVPGTGALGTIAQAGLTAYNGRSHTLRGSGTDQIRNLARLSNLNEAGLWIFRSGDIGSINNVEEPDVRQIVSQQVTINQGETSCATAFSLCHSQATCVDTNQKFCCMCRKGFYGNGYNCLKESVPLRASGKVNLNVNGVKLSQQDIQVYIVPADGRVYAAISKIPKSIGNLLQVMYPVTGMLNWLFAIPTSNGLNGFQITGGVLEHSADIIFKNSNDKISVVQKFLGINMFDQLTIELQIQGTVPAEIWDRLDINDYQMQFNFIAPGIFRSSSSSLVYKVTPAASQEPLERQIALEQTIKFNESCALDFQSVQSGQRGQYSYYRVKTARTFISYEGPENILRFAATSKVSLLTENDDPCIEGRIKCVANSSCVVEGDAFKCLCNPGFQTTYTHRYNEVGHNDFGCLDVNECAEGKASCNENAMCVNEVGSYRCACKTGYTGDGYTCTEIDSPCGDDFSRCNPLNSYCTIPNDYRTCNCTQGFQKIYTDDRRISFTCIDINECERNPCGPYSVCRNVAGSYSCECRPGYTGDGYNCQRATTVDGCESLHCGSNSVCTNSAGTYTCECKQGYSGNGYQCHPEDSTWKTDNNCSPNGEWIFNETSQSYACRCIRGYYGDGYQCMAYGGRSVVPILCKNSVCVCPLNFVAMENWCVMKEYANALPANSSINCNMLANICHPHAQCVYSSGALQYHCVCNSGYDGSGYDCSEIEVSCLERSDLCDQHATCKVNGRTGKANCVCNTHYQGDGFTCVYFGTCTSDNDCKANEECFYNEGILAYECRCRRDYVKGADGYCQLARQCTACHSLANCVQDSTSGHSSCQCPPGYRGDGIRNCERTSQPNCEIDNNCSPFATCDYNAAVGAYECHCKRGFIGNGTVCSIAKTCYEMPEMCDRNARCLSVVQLSYSSPSTQCQCNPGYIGNGTHCSEIPTHEGGFLFVNWGTATLRVPYDPTVANPGYPIQTETNQIAIGLTIDCQRNRVLWSDYYGQKIKSATFRGKNVMTVVNGNITAPEGLALDWLNQAMYWTDSGKKVIESINLDGGNRRVVISKNLTNPRGIAVDPYRRKLFWSDWNRAQPKIEWSNIDGSERAVFVSGSDVQLPNSVTIDTSTDELCWADAGVKRIMCIGIENRIPRMITSNCVSPFGLTVSANRYYWTEKSLGKVGYFDKITLRSGNITLPTTGTGTLYGIVNVPTEC